MCIYSTLEVLRDDRLLILGWNLGIIVTLPSNITDTYEPQVKVKSCT